jgi:hypothetical protein
MSLSGDTDSVCTGAIARASFVLAKCRKQLGDQPVWVFSPSGNPASRRNSPSSSPIRQGNPGSYFARPPLHRRINPFSDPDFTARTARPPVDYAVDVLLPHCCAVERAVLLRHMKQRRGQISRDAGGDDISIESSSRMY